MTNQGKGLRLLAVAVSTTLVVMSPILGHADPPTFPTTISQGVTCQVWDIAGTIVYTEDVPDVGIVTLTFVVATDDKGKITGTGVLDATFFVPGLGDFVMDLSDAGTKGKVKSSRVGPSKLQLKSNMTGTTSGAGFIFPTKGSVKFKGEIDSVGDLQGTGSLQLKLVGARAKSRGPVALDVTPDPANDGTWDLNLNITSADGVKLTGSGDAELATGRTVDDLIAKGKYSAKNDSSKVSLKNATGAKVQLKKLVADASTETLSEGSLKYSLLGQKKAVEIPDGCP